ncbi:MAG: VanW family protein, partial [Miltoncostaeaceae bacterium]
RSLDMGAIVRAMAAGPPERTVRARFRITTPEVLTAELEPLGIRELVGSFTTSYNCCEPRVTNIQVGARALDATILAPGERLSLNDALGPRTVEGGYVEAPQISGGELEDGVGGGVSQIATTLFNAAFFAGLEIETHQPHSFYISRYPAGREATISMDGPDLIFVNDWDAHLYISAMAGDNDLSIRLFSTSFDRRVETTSTEPTDYEEPETIERVDSSLDPGAREVDQYSGSAGFSVSYTRTVYEGDRVRAEETYRWRYSPQNAYVRIGPEEEDEDDTDEPDAGEEGSGDGTGTTPGDASDPPAPDPEPAPSPSPAPAPGGGGGAPPPPELP